jgi:tRNA G18 (ribose-2'-O)-methylase SpoU
MSTDQNTSKTPPMHSSPLTLSSINNNNTIYLLLENPRPNNPLGPILRCAAAYNISTIIVVGGYDRCAVQGSHGANKHVRLHAFATHPQAVEYLRNELQCTQIVGILGGVAGAYHRPEGYAAVVVRKEKTDMVHVSSSSSLTASAASSESSIANKRSYPISTRPFISGNCCFAVSKDWTGLPISLARHCDLFVHVPHDAVVPSVITKGDHQQHHNCSLLDSPSTLSIVLHHFTAWANYGERKFKGHKFQVSVDRHDVLQARQQETRAKRQQKRAEDATEDITNLGLFESQEISDY